MNDEPNHILKVKSQTKSLEITLEAQNSALLSVNPAVKFHFRAHALSTVGDSDPDSNRRQGRGLPPDEEPPKKTPLKEPLIKLRGSPKALARYNLNDKHLYNM